MVCFLMPLGGMLYECMDIPMYVCGGKEKEKVKVLNQRPSDLKPDALTPKLHYAFTRTYLHAVTQRKAIARLPVLYLFITEELISFAKS